MSESMTINGLPVSEFSPCAKKLWDKIQALGEDSKKASEEVKKAREEMEKKQRTLELKEQVKDELASMLAQEIDDIKSKLSKPTTPPGTIFPNVLT